MSQMVDLHATCTVKSAHMAIVQSSAAPCRTLHIVGRLALVVAAIAGLRCLDCTALGSAVHHTARLVQSHRLDVHRSAVFQRARRHPVILADTPAVCIGRLWPMHRTGPALERLLVVVVGWCKFAEHTVVVMDHAVPSQDDWASRNLSALRRTPSAVPKANVVALRRQEPALRLNAQTRISHQEDLFNTSYSSSMFSRPVEGVDRPEKHVIIVDFASNDDKDGSFARECTRKVDLDRAALVKEA